MLEHGFQVLNLAPVYDVGVEEREVFLSQASGRWHGESEGIGGRISRTRERKGPQ